MTKKRFYVLIAFLFAAIFALVCAITLAACGGDEEEDKNPSDTTEELPEGDGGDENPDQGDDEDSEGSSPEAHTHTYGDPVWAWQQGGDGAWTCETVTITCTGCDETADGHTLTTNATVTSGTSGASCTTQTITYTATATLNGQKIEDTKTETIAASENHTYTAKFTWTPSEESFSVSVTFTCSECETSYTDATGATVSGPDGDGIYTATIYDSYNTPFTSTYDPNDGIYFVSIEDYAHMTAKVGDTFTLEATIKDGHGNAVDVTREGGSITWKSDENGSLITLAESEGAITCNAAGTAIVYAVYTDSEGETWTSEPYYILISAAKTTPEGDQYDVKIDFSNAEGLGVGSEQMVALDTESNLTYVDIDLEGQIDNGALKTNSFTKYGNTTYTNYILVDFSQFSGYSFELNVMFTAENTNTTMAVVNALVENAGGYGQSSSIFGDTAPNLGDEIYKAEYNGEATTLTYSGTVSSANETVYIVWEGAVEISAMSLSLWTGDRKTVLDGSWEGVDIDFSVENAELRTNINTGDIGMGSSGEDVYTAKVLVDGILTLVDEDNEVSWGNANSYITTGAAGLTGEGYTSKATYSNAITDYFVVNLYGLEGETVTVTIVFSTISGEDGTLYVVDSLEGFTEENASYSGTALAQKTGKTDQKLSAAITVPESGVLYIEYNTPIKIYSIKIGVGSNEDTSPVYNIEIDTANASTQLEIDGEGTTLTAVITENGEVVSISDLEGAALTWTSSDDSIVTVNESGVVTVTATDEGSAQITVTFTYGDVTITSGAVTIVVLEPATPEGTRVYVDFATWTDYFTERGEAVDNSDVVFDDEGILTLVDSSCLFDAGENYVTSDWKNDTGAGYTVQGNTVDDTGEKITTYDKYFMIDLSGLSATHISIEIRFTAGSATSGTMYLTSELMSVLQINDSKVVASENTSGVGEENLVTLTYEEDISDLEALYIEFSCCMHFYSIDITIS